MGYSYTMSNVTHIRQENPADTHSALVAAEVRGYLAKRRIPTYKVHEYLGQSRSYWQRRVSGELPLNISDLAQLGGLVGQPLAAFIPATLPPMPEPEKRHSDYGSALSGRVIPFRPRRSA